VEECFDEKSADGKNAGLTWNMAKIMVMNVVFNEILNMVLNKVLNMV